MNPIPPIPSPTAFAARGTSIPGPDDREKTRPRVVSLNPGEARPQLLYRVVQGGKESFHTDLTAVCHATRGLPDAVVQVVRLRPANIA